MRTQCKHNEYVHVPLKTCCDVFRKINIFIPEGHRCCHTHMIGKSFFEDDLAHLRVVSITSKISAKEVVSFFKTFLTNANMSLFDKMSENNMPENQLKILTGLS